jgi:UDP-N-acetylmuramate dehydrogenase
LEQSGRVSVWPVEHFEYGYRTSILKEQSTDCGVGAVVLDAEFALLPAQADALRLAANQIVARRKESQPKGATCGSVFKNPAGDYAGRLIDEAGLKGRRCGGAQISPLHANFVVNLGQATAADIKCLIDLSQATVLDRFGLKLETEIELIGEW